MSISPQKLLFYLVKFFTFSLVLIPLIVLGQSVEESKLQAIAERIAKNNHPQESIDSLKRLVAKKPSMNTLNLLGFCYNFLDDTSNELEVFKKSFSLFPKNNFAPIYLADIYGKMYQEENQLNALKAMLVEFPRDFRANVDLGWLHLAKDDQKAYDIFTKMQKSKIPILHKSKFYEGMAVALQNLRRPEESNLYFDKALEQDKSPIFYLRKSVNYQRMNEPLKEIQQIELAIALFDSMQIERRIKKTAFMALGKAYKGIAEFEKARQPLLKYIEMEVEMKEEEKNPYPYFHLMICEIELDHFDKACEYFKAACKYGIEETDLFYETFGLDEDSDVSSSDKFDDFYSACVKE